MVTLVRQAFFEKHLLPKLSSPSGELEEAHSLFCLSMVNNRLMRVSRYFEMDIELLEFRFPG